MKKEEQIKRLRIELLAYNDTISFTEASLLRLAANRKEVIEQLEQLVKPLKHHHMKDIVSIGYLTADMSIYFSEEEENIDWNEWDKVQIVGVDKQYGIVVKATEKKEDPNQFTLFFCKKK